jgi:hypothetical protein
MKTLNRLHRMTRNLPAGFAIGVISLRRQARLARIAVRACLKTLFTEQRHPDPFVRGLQDITQSGTVFAVGIGTLLILFWLHP